VTDALEHKNGRPITGETPFEFTLRTVMALRYLLQKSGAEEGAIQIPIRPVVHSEDGDAHFFFDSSVWNLKSSNVMSGRNENSVSEMR
jgi:hypothetical protein